MSSLQFFLHKDRHVVVAEGSETDGKVLVKWVDFSSNVEGAHRRGRRPNYSEPVAMSELTPLDSNEELVAKAERVLSSAAKDVSSN